MCLNQVQLFVTVCKCINLIIHFQFYYSQGYSEFKANPKNTGYKAGKLILDGASVHHTALDQTQELGVIMHNCKHHQAIFFVCLFNYSLHFLLNVLI